jgi:hypothetical protein
VCQFAEEGTEFSRLDVADVGIEDGKHQHGPAAESAVERVRVVIAEEEEISRAGRLELDRSWRANASRVSLSTA